MLLIASGAVDPEIGERLLLFMFAIAVAIGVLGGSVVGLNLVAPLREISTAVSRVSDGDLTQPIPVVGNDVLAQLADSHNRLAADSERRNRQLGMILAAVESAEPRDGIDAMADKAARDAEEAFGFIAAVIQFVDPDSVAPEERIPGVSVPIRAELRAGDERFGLLLASLPATRTWERADQTLLDLYASEVGVAIRNAELFTQVQDQNQQLRQLSEVKDDFLRGVSHNLQTPLTSIRSNADALATVDSDPRLTIISDQADRLTRMVQQLLLVGRLESQPPRPTADVLAIGPRVQRAWDALAIADRPLHLNDGAPDWLAVADADQLDQVLWALLDNAVKYGQGDGHGRDRRGRGREDPVDHRLRRRSRARGIRPGLAVRSLRARRRRPNERQRQRPWPLCLARAHARDGRRPGARRRRARPRRDVPADSPR